MNFNPNVSEKDREATRSHKLWDVPSPDKKKAGQWFLATSQPV
jgi:hypothetical protein